MSDWIRALKEWNKNKSSWCVPKKGSADYNEVRAIMGRMQPMPKTKKQIKEEKERKTRVEKIKKESKQKEVKRKERGPTKEEIYEGGTRRRGKEQGPTKAEIYAGGTRRPGKKQKEVKAKLPKPPKGPKPVKGPKPPKGPKPAKSKKGPKPPAVDIDDMEDLENFWEEMKGWWMLEDYGRGWEDAADEKKFQKEILADELELPNSFAKKIISYYLSDAAIKRTYKPAERNWWITLRSTLKKYVGMKDNYEGQVRAQEDLEKRLERFKTEEERREDERAARRFRSAMKRK